MDQFYRRIKLKTHFQETHKQADLSDEEHRFKSESNKHWVHTKTLRTIGTFIESTKKCINKQLTKNKKRSYGNLTEKELGVFEQLKRSNYITIKSANKGRTTVIQDVEQYIEAAKR